MNESELEDELRQLRPRAPSARLEDAIARSLESPVARREQSFEAALPSRLQSGALGQILAGLCWAFGGAAAAALVIFAVRSPVAAVPTVTPVQSVAASAASGFEPSESSRELLQAEDGGLILDGGDGPTKVLRYSSVERHSWLDPQTGASLEIEAPRVDVVFLPVSVQ